MKKILLLICLLNLAACSQKPSTVFIYKGLPPELLISPCYSTKAGTTVPALVEAYVYNLGCLKAFELQLQAQQQYSENVQ